MTLKKTGKSTKPAHPLFGAKAPAFSLSDSGGAKVSLKDLLGRGKLVLYFYPRDMTTGCTKEACGFRDSLSALDQLGAKVVGVSPDPPASHQKFAAKLGLNFPLLSDPNNQVARLYGVYRQKSLYGRKFMGVERTTFLIDHAGVVRKVFSKVEVDGHPSEVIEALNQLP